MNTTCKYCLKRGMNWQQINGKWRLMDRDGLVHSCDALRKLKIEESKLKKAYS